MKETKGNKSITEVHEELKVEDVSLEVKPDAVFTQASKELPHAKKMEILKGIQQNHRKTKYIVMNTFSADGKPFFRDNG